MHMLADNPLARSGEYHVRSDVDMTVIDCLLGHYRSRKLADNPLARSGEFHVRSDVESTASDFLGSM